MLSNEQIILYLWNNNKHTFVIVWKYYNSHVSKIDQPPTINFWLSSLHATPPPKFLSHEVHPFLKQMRMYDDYCRLNRLRILKSKNSDKVAQMFKQRWYLPDLHSTSTCSLSLNKLTKLGYLCCYSMT